MRKRTIELYIFFNELCSFPGETEEIIHGLKFMINK